MKLILLFFLFFFPAVSFSQLKKSVTYKTERFEFVMGGTVTIVGAPRGAISIEGWQSNEVLVEAEIEIQAETESDISLLSTVTGFVLDRDLNYSRIVSVGTHDKGYMKRFAKNFPKRLLSMPFKIDYRIKVPIYCDLEISGGSGDFSFQGVDGTISVRFIESNLAKMKVSGGAIDAFFGKGSVEVELLTSSWRGRFLNVGLGSGQVQVSLPSGMNAELQASVLRSGKIESLFPLKPRFNDQVNEKTINTKLGNGGAILSFRVADGVIRILQK